MTPSLIDLIAIGYVVVCLEWLGTLYLINRWFK